MRDALRADRPRVADGLGLFALLRDDALPAAGVAVAQARGAGRDVLAVRHPIVRGDAVEHVAVVSADERVRAGQVLQDRRPQGQVELETHDLVGHTAVAQVVQQFAQTGRAQLVVRAGAGGEVDEGVLVLAQGPQSGLELLDQHALEVAAVRRGVQHGAQRLELRGQGAVLRDRLRDAAGHSGADVAAGQLPQLLSLLRGGEQARVHVRDLRAGTQELASGLLEAVPLEEAHVAAHGRAVLRGARRGQQVREAVLEDLRRECVECGPDLLEQQERTAPCAHGALRVETGLAQHRQRGLGERGHQLAGADGPLLRPGDLVRGVDASTEPDGVAHLHREGAHAGLLQQPVAHGRALLR